MSIARFAVNRPVAVVMRIAAFVLLGLVCLTRLPVDLLPDVTLPVVVVSTQWPNVGPEEMEAQITRPLERAVSSTPGMYQVSSSSSEGGSSVRVQFNWGVDIGQAALDVVQAVQRASRSFPNDRTLQPPTVFKLDPTLQPILMFGITGIDDPVKLRSLLDNEISPMLDSVSGVASAAVTGGEQRDIMVDVDPDRLRARHLSLADVSRRIAEENLNLPAGIAKQGNTEFTIRTLGWFKSPDDIRRLPVGSFNGQLVSIGDIADVRDSHSETRQYTRFNGEIAAGILVSKQSGANTISTAEGVMKRIEEINKAYPQLKFSLAYSQADYIEHAVNNVRDSAIIGGILAVLILMFFLRNLRSTLVVALSIPTSIISTFALLYACGFTINTMSLGGLALATGLIVDDAVVVLENIFRHMERDKKKATEAAVEGTNEIFSAVVASTWTVMVVFLPLLLMKGQAGQMYTQFALVVIFSLAVSLLDATTTVPMLASRFISGEAHAENLASAASHPNALMRAFHRVGEWIDSLDKTYSRGLNWALRHRMLTVGGALAITFSAGLLVPWIGSELMPQTDSGDFSVQVRMPIGTSLEQTNKVMLQVEKIIMENPDVQSAFAAAGSSLSVRGVGGSLRPFRGSVSVKLKKERKASTQSVMRDLQRKLGRIPGVAARPQQVDIVAQIIAGGNQNVEVDIFGNDLSELSRLSKEVMGRVRDVPGYGNVDVNWEESMPEIAWQVDRQKAQLLGVSFQDIADTISTATKGDVAGYYQESGFQYPIVVQIPEAYRKTVDEMKNLVVKSSPAGSSAGEIVLSQVAVPVYGFGPSEITRQDRRRYIAVTGVPTGRPAGDIQKDIEAAMKGFEMPTGYSWDWGTNQKRRAEEFGGMWIAVVLAIGLIYMLLASQFESMVHPLTILLSVPLAGSGVILGLFLTDRAFGLTAFIGVLMLVGIVVKNGILLVDYTNTLRRRGMEREEALRRAGPTRLRPILMTASAAVLGMLPLALALGEGSEVQAPMATAVIGGLITSTCLTLFVVPVVYSLLDDLTGRLHKSSS